MGLITNLLRDPQAAAPADHDDAWFGAMSRGTSSGVSVTPDTAAALTAVMACVRVIAESVAMLPLIIYRRLPNGDKERAPDHPLFDLLHNQPNNWQTSYEFWEMLVGHVGLRGNAYAEIVPGRRGAVTQLIPLNPDTVTVEQLGNGTLRYKIKRADNTFRILPQQQVLHIRDLSHNGITGITRIQLHAETVALALAAQIYGSKFFSNDATGRAVLQTDAVLDPEARKNLRDSWLAANTGLANAHKVAVLEEGLKYQQIGVSNEDAQFLQTRKFQVEEIARMFRTPLHKIQNLDKATFSNIEQQAIEFVTDTLMPWLVRIEKAILRDLITESAEFFAEFLVTGLLRGDTKSRFEAYAIGINTGFMSRNEVRRLENLNAADGLDKFLEPLNMGKAGEKQPDKTDTATADESETQKTASAEPVSATYEAPEPPAKQPQPPDEIAGLAEICRALAIPEPDPIIGTTAGPFVPEPEPPVPVAPEALDLLVFDAADVIAATERRGLLGRVGKAGNDHQRWAHFLTIFYEKQHKYIVRRIGPILEAVSLESETKPDPLAIATTICDQAKTVLFEGDATETLATWEKTRTEEIFDLITKGIHNE